MARKFSKKSFNNLYDKCEWEGGLSGLLDYGNPSKGEDDKFDQLFDLFKNSYENLRNYYYELIQKFDIEE